jgi:G3E family GTPase
LTLTTLVTGGSAGARELAIAQVLLPGTTSAVIVEGLSDGNAILADHALAPHVVRIAPGCLCCAGNLILRVTLNRLLRRPPARLFISLANGEHVGQLRQWLSQAPYDALLTLEDAIELDRAGHAGAQGT